MTVKFFLSALLTIACMASNGYADKAYDTQPLSIKTNQKAGAEAFKAGIKFRAEGKEQEAKAAFKMAAQYYRNAGKKDDAARMERLVNKTGSVQEKLNERFSKIDQHLNDNESTDNESD